jgi:hypothetical protein
LVNKRYSLKGMIMMVAEKSYVVNIIYRSQGQKPKGISRATLPQPSPRRLEDRPVIINGSKAVTL